MTTLAQIGLAAPADAAGSTIAWFTLAGALGGVLITGVIALATAMLNHRWQARGDEQRRLLQHGAQVRQERRETYAAYWLAWNRFTHELRRVTDQARELPAGFSPRKNLDEQLKSTANPGSLKPQIQELIEKAWEAELEWRAAADAMFLIAGPAVDQTAHIHIAMTEQKLAAAWKGESHHDENGAAYRGLNDAMRADLLSPGTPEQWAP
jgi:hypothetical protein